MAGAYVHIYTLQNLPFASISSGTLPATFIEMNDSKIRVVDRERLKIGYHTDRLKIGVDRAERLKIGDRG